MQNMSVNEKPAHGSGKLVVEIKNGEKIKKVNSFGGDPDPYVTIRVKEDRSSRVEKTHVVKDKRNPVWGSTFEFNIRDSRRDGNMEFTCWQKNSMFADGKIGSCTVTMEHLMENMNGSGDLVVNLSKNGGKINVHLQFISDATN